MLLYVAVTGENPFLTVVETAVCKLQLPPGLPLSQVGNRQQGRLCSNTTGHKTSEVTGNQNCYRT